MSKLAGVVSADEVLDMLAEYYRDCFHSEVLKETRVGKKHEEFEANARVLVGRFLYRVLKHDMAGTIFYCNGYSKGHFWWKVIPDSAAVMDRSFLQRCEEHPERRSDDRRNI